MNEDNIIVQKSKSFSLKIITLYKFLVDEKKEYVLSKQILKSGTSIGANIKEAIRGQSKADFYAKMNISLKEASETEYWLELLKESNYIPSEVFREAYTQCQELLRILMAITKTQRKEILSMHIDH